MWFKDCLYPSMSNNTEHAKFDPGKHVQMLVLCECIGKNMEIWKTVQNGLIWLNT